MFDLVSGRCLDQCLHVNAFWKEYTLRLESERAKIVIFALSEKGARDAASATYRSVGGSWCLDTHARDRNVNTLIQVQATAL